MIGIIKAIFGSRNKNYDIYMIEVVALATHEVMKDKKALDRCKIALAQYMNDCKQNDPTAKRIKRDVSRAMSMNSKEFIEFGTPYVEFMREFARMMKYNRAAMTWFECAYESFLDDRSNS